MRSCMWRVCGRTGESDMILVTKGVCSSHAKSYQSEVLLQHALLYVESVWEDWGVRYDTSDKRCLQFARKELPMMILIRSELPKTYLITYIRERGGNHLEEEWFFGGIFVATLRTFCKFYVVLWVLCCFEYLALEEPINGIWIWIFAFFFYSWIQSFLSWSCFGDYNFSCIRHCWTYDL